MINDDDDDDDDNDDDDDVDNGTSLALRFTDVDMR